MKIVKGGKGRAALDVQLLTFPAPTKPAERAFNAAVDALVGTLDEPEADDPAGDRYEYNRTMRLVFASPELISAHLEGYNDTGGAHPNSFSGNVNIDIARGREAQFPDLLDPPGAKTVFALCLKQVVAQKKARMGDEAPLKAADLKELSGQVAEATGQLRSWSFGPEKATVDYDAYAVGAYVEGAYSCEIPYSALKPLAKAGFPFPESSAGDLLFRVIRSYHNLRYESDGTGEKHEADVGCGTGLLAGRRGERRRATRSTRARS